MKNIMKLCTAVTITYNIIIYIYYIGNNTFQKRNDCKLLLHHPNSYNLKYISLGFRSKILVPVL